MSIRAEVDLAKLRGAFISFPLLSGRIIPAMVSTEDSEAKRDGWDFIFMTCGLRCARELRKTLNEKSVHRA